jgi:hypothetical protein
LKILEKTFQDIIISNNFPNRALIVQEIRGRTDNDIVSDFKSFCTSKETIIREKRQPQNERKIIASYSCDKGLISRIHKELNLNTKRTNNLLSGQV